MGDDAISDAALWTADDANKLVQVVKSLERMQCRLCLLRGHEASYCPFNAQMNRATTSNPDLHLVWKKWRIARGQYVKNQATFATMTAACKASKSRADTAASVFQAASQSF